MTTAKTLIERPNWTLELVPVAITTVEDTPIRTEIIGHALVLFATREAEDAPDHLRIVDGTEWSVPDEGRMLIAMDLIESYPCTPLADLIKAVEGGYPHRLPNMGWRMTVPRRVSAP